MDFNFLVPLLMMFTLLAALVFALVSKRKTENKLHDPKDPNSSLATDGAEHRAKNPGPLE